MDITKGQRDIWYMWLYDFCLFIGDFNPTVLQLYSDQLTLSCSLYVPTSSKQFLLQEYEHTCKSSLHVPEIFVPILVSSKNISFCLYT